MMGSLILFQIVQTLVQWYFMLGMIRQCLYIVRGGTGFRADLVFPPPMMYLKMVGVMFVISSICLLCLLPVGIIFVFGVVSGALLPPPRADFAVTAMQIGSMLLITLLCSIPAIWISVRLHFAHVFIADWDASCIDSMKCSWNVTSGNFWMLLMAGIIFGICAMSGMILLFVGAIFTLAIPYLGAALAYLQLTGEPIQHQPHPSTRKTG
jgi:hypothetical protein